MERKTQAESDPQEPRLPIMYSTLCPMSNTTEASQGELFGYELCHDGRAAASTIAPQSTLTLWK